MLLYGACLLKEPTKASEWSGCWGHLLEPAPQAQGSHLPPPTGAWGLSPGHCSNSGKDFSWLNSTFFIAAHVWSRVVKSNLCRHMSASALLSWGTRAQAVEPQTTPCGLSNKPTSRFSSLNGDILFQQIHTPLVPATTLGMGAHSIHWAHLDAPKYFHNPPADRSRFPPLSQFDSLSSLCDWTKQD